MERHSSYQLMQQKEEKALDLTEEQKCLNLARHRFEDERFDTLIYALKQQTRLQELILTKSLITAPQIDRLKLLSSTNKGLRIVDSEGHAFGPAYMNWHGYNLSKNSSDLSTMKELVARALDFIEQDRGSLPEFALDFGASVGSDTIPLVQAGCRKVWSLDSDAEALEMLKKNVPPEFSACVTCIQLPFKELQIKAEVDLLIACHSLPYRAPADFPACWQKCIDVLKVGGYFAGHFFGPPSHRQPDIAMTYHREVEVQELFAKDFDIRWFKKEAEGSNFKIYGGSDVPWSELYHVVAQK